eukprot:5493721-Amphidinium_carterae.1
MKAFWPLAEVTGKAVCTPQSLSQALTVQPQASLARWRQTLQPYCIRHPHAFSWSPHPPVPATYGGFQRQRCSSNANRCLRVSFTLHRNMSGCFEVRRALGIEVLTCMDKRHGTPIH